MVARMTKWVFVVLAFLVVSPNSVRAGVDVPGSAAPLDVSKLSQKYRGWSYYPDFVIPPTPKGPGIINPTLTDVGIVWRAPDLAEWRMFYTFFNGTGYQTALAISADMLHWDTATHGRVFTFHDTPHTFDFGGVVLGGVWYGNSSLYSPLTLRTGQDPARPDRVWQLYGSYAFRNGYESRPGAIGAAFSDDGGLTWSRASTNGSALSIYGPGAVGGWEADCIYQPWLVEHQGTVYNFYNAANGGTEKSGIATLPVAAMPGVGHTAEDSEWERSPLNPVLRGDTPSDDQMASDPKVYYDDQQGVWVMFYFGVGSGTGGHACIYAAFSTDLLSWQADPVPLYKAGGHPAGLDADHAHKVSLAYNESTDTLYMYYTAVGQAGRGIALLTSRPLPARGPRWLRTNVKAI